MALSSEDYSALLTHFPRYLRQAWRDLGHGRGYFGDPGHGEGGMRTQGNVVFTTALLASLAEKGELEPVDMSAQDLVGYARAGIAYMTEGHQSGTLTCADGQRWGCVWQSAWWATRMALGASLIWHHLNTAEQDAVQRVVVTEADLQLSRIVPTGLAEDTKAEENAWDAEILACACALIPDHPQRALWWDKLRDFAVNTFSVAADLGSSKLCDGQPIKDQVHTVNLHSDYTLENHGSYHFCYVASPLHSIAWCTLALVRNGISPPEALYHHVEEVWRRAKPTFLDTRFAYVSGKDWARYTYGLYFILPALVMLQHRYEDGDAVFIERARLACLAEEQRLNDDGSFFGRRFTQPHYHGQTAKYETDCYANLGIAYLLHQLLPTKAAAPTHEQFQHHVSACHVSPESGIAFLRQPTFFASFSWRTLTSPFPIALFVPIGHDSLAEWQAHNLLGHIVTNHGEPTAVGIRGMKAHGQGFRIQGILSYQGRKGRFIYEHHIEMTVDPELRQAHIRTRFVANGKVFVKRCEGLRLAIANDQFNTCQRRFYTAEGEKIIRFDPERKGFLHGKRGLPVRVLRRLWREWDRDTLKTGLKGSWVNIDDALGVVSLTADTFLLRQPSGRNVADGSLHYELLYCPYRRLNRWFQPGEVIMENEFIVLAGDRQKTEALAAEKKNNV